jgi:hypothetical protein
LDSILPGHKYKVLKKGEVDMRLASWEWFWYVVAGFVMGSASVFIVTKLNAMDIDLIWYEWILGVLSMLIFMFMVQTFIASFKEFKPRAAWMTIVFMGSPILLIGAILVGSVLSRSVD